VWRNLVPDFRTADREGALSELAPSPHDNSCVGCSGKQRPATRISTVKFHNVTEICQAMLMTNSMHHGGNLELNSCFHRPPAKTL